MTSLPKSSHSVGGFARRLPLLLVLVLVCSHAWTAEPAAAGRQRVDISAAPFTAVGQVNNNAYGRCTGVLVARNLAVTAAHCLFNRSTRRFMQGSSIHFVLGYDRGRFTFQTTALSTRIGEGYDPLRPIETIGNDWALLELADPAPATIEPMPVAPEAPAAGSSFVSAGFGQDRPYALTVAGPCPYLPLAGAPVIATRCSIVKGYSGGPLIDDRNRLIGIQVAGARKDGQDFAFAVPSTAWSGPLRR